MEIKFLGAIEITDEFLTDILITAVEGGINYWSTVGDYRYKADNPAERGVTVYEDEESFVHGYDNKDGAWTAMGTAINLYTLGKAVERMMSLNESVSCHNSYREHIVNAVMEKDAGDLDAGDCDLIMQVAALGDVVYG